MSALTITFRCLRGEEGHEEVVAEETVPALEFGTVDKIAKGFRVNGERLVVEFEFSPTLVVEFSEAELSG